MLLPPPTIINGVISSREKGKGLICGNATLLGKIGRSKGDEIEILNGHNWTALFNNTKWGETYEIS